MEITEAIEHRGPVTLPDSFVLPLGSVISPPHIEVLHIQTDDLGEMKAEAKVSWTMKPWSTSEQLRRVSHLFAIADLRAA